MGWTEPALAGRRRVTDGAAASLLALVLALTLLVPAADAAPGGKLPRNSVTSKSIKNRQVKSNDIAKGAVRTSQIRNDAVDGSKVADASLGGGEINEETLDFNVLQRRLTGGCPAGEAIRSLDAAGNPTCVGILGTLTGPVGGDLTGTLPNPTIAENAIDSLKVLNDSLTGNDVVEATLGIVPNADRLDGINSTDFLLDSEATGFLDETDLARLDARLDALCAQADAVNQEVRDLRAALDIPALTGVGIGLDLSAVDLPEFDPTACQG